MCNVSYLQYIRVNKTAKKWVEWMNESKNECNREWINRIESCVSNEPKVETRTNAIIANFRSESYIGNV